MSETTYAPGESPFRTKGNVYKSLLESADARVPGGREAVLSRIDDPALATFFAQSFLAASSYDVFPIVPFGMIGARIAGQQYPEFVRGGAIFTAKRDMNGIYKVLLKLASPDAVAKRIPRILLQYFDFGRVEDARFTSERCYEATYRGIPRALQVWLINIAKGFMPVVMESAGARDVEVKIMPPTEEGLDRGVMLQSVPFAITWTRR